MAAIPPPPSATVTAIYDWWAAKPRYPSIRLGASLIGEECEARIWRTFRWCEPPEAQPDGRKKRLFDRGNREEAVFTEELRGIGCQVLDVDPSTNKQFRFTDLGGHLVAKIDGVGLGIPEAPKAWHNLSYKTFSTKYWAPLIRDGVYKAQPKYWAQNQVEMHLASLERTLFLAVNKDTDELFAERIRYDKVEAERLVSKAERVIFAQQPPPRLSDDPAYFKCKTCPVVSNCQRTALPPVSCRTCLHSTPERDGDARWSCAYWKADIPTDAQREGCEHHLYIPALLQRWGDPVDANEEEGWVEYRAPDGVVFRNGPWAENTYTSRELEKCSPALLRNEEFLAIRAKHAGRVVEFTETPEIPA